MKRRKTTAGLGSYGREYDYAETRLEDLLARMGQIDSALARAWDAVESGSASRAFRAKQALQDANARLQGAIETAEIAEKTSGRRLDALPKYGEFVRAHELMALFRRTLARAEALRKRVTKTAFGDALNIRAGLEAERDRSRSRVRRSRS